MNTDGESNEANNSLRMSLRERPRKLHAERKLRERCDELKFLDDFDPEKSNREKRKLKRKGSQQSSRSLYDEYGRIRHNGLDVCDCMNEDCPGCWFECENCGSTKCGLQCRVNRKFFYESIAFDGKDAIIKNKHFPTTSLFIGGIGIPTDLTYESLTIGYVLKAEFWLPWNSTVFYENPYLPQYKKISYSRRHFKRDMDHKTTLRWNIYETLMETLNSYGYKGQECVLKAICEANAVPFRRHYSVFDELMHIFFSPSRSCDLKSEDSQHFLEAGKLGHNGESSCELYECSLSLLELISTIS
uniref:ARF7EP_C domain-containing protein n=1 Tax=Glossina austeni TaxID=7395 RepID=A0A1A9V237_GLOAU